MFFLGLLSTPLPYLLLAAFYFVGFAMGVFNNSNGDEPVETIASVTIQAESVSSDFSEDSYYFQTNYKIQSVETIILKPENPSIPSILWLEKQLFPDTDLYIPESRYSSFRFSRPPPYVG